MKDSTTARVTEWPISSGPPVVFGVVVVLTCCYVGLKTTGGPEEIGRSVTRAVVLSFMMIFVLNYLITRSLM